jgi:hypothetical protein
VGGITKHSFLLKQELSLICDTSKYQGAKEAFTGGYVVWIKGPPRLEDAHTRGRMVTKREFFIGICLDMEKEPRQMLCSVFCIGIAMTLRNDDVSVWII